MATLITVAVIIWILAFVLKWKLPVLIGKSGERFVTGVLSKLDSQHYKVVNDLMLPSSGNTSATQIDHVVVSNFGIFVIETKAYSGWIFGNAQQQHWTQVIYRYKKKFYNPLRQNYAHIKAVEALVRPNFPSIPIVGLVAFPDAERLQVSGTDTVGRARDVLQKIETYTSSVVSDDQRDTIVGILLAANIQDKSARKMHNREAYALKSSRGF